MPRPNPITAEWLLEDAKTYPDVARALGVASEADPLRRLARYVGLDPTTPELEDPEGQGYDPIARRYLPPDARFLDVGRRYSALGWPSEGYADVIASWWTTAQRALALTAEDLGHPYAPPRKQRFAAQVVEDDPELAEFLAVLDGSRHAAVGHRLRRLAALTHTIANFMPCPPRFNQDKGARHRATAGEPSACDYLDLQADSLQVRHTRATSPDRWLVRHHDFLVGNRSRFCLQDWYDVDRDGRLVGIPLFEGQSLDHPVPGTVAEAAACLGEMVARIERRAARIAATAR